MNREHEIKVSRFGARRAKKMAIYYLGKCEMLNAAKAMAEHKAHVIRVAELELEAFNEVALTLVGKGNGSVVEALGNGSAWGPRV